ncbi:MAG: transcriptional regulator GcvA [Pseudomonadota bacterium]
MARSLPPLNALRAFEAAARHLSFTKAAEELNVTPAAVSHQVKALEALYGVSLFQRLTRALRLTEAGQAAHPLIGQGLDKLAQGSEQISAHAGRQVLTISVGPSFGAMWLVPRLERFRKRHPEIEIRLDGTDRLATVGSDGVDVAVRYGPGGYKGVRVDFLFAQMNMPVCSPALLAGSRPLQAPEDLAHHTLLHIDWKEAEATWRMWLLAASLPHIDPTKGPVYTMESMAVQAALDGQGVALVGDVLVADALAAGRLVRPFGAELKTPLSFSYYLISPLSDSEDAKVTAFRNWLLAEAGLTAR